MFDFFRSGEKSRKYLLGALLTLVALSMVITLIPGFGGSGSLGSADQTVAEVCKETITTREVQVNLQDTLRRGNLPNDLIPVYVPQIINQLVNDRAMACYAEEIGVRVTDADVAQAIQQTIPSLWQDGKFVGKDQYAQFLASNSMTIAEFERKMRASAVLRRLSGVVLDGMVVSPREVENEYKARNEKAIIEYIPIVPTKLSAQINVTDQEVAARFNEQKGQHRSPERRGFRMLILDEQKAGENLKLSDDELRRFYDQNKEQFRTPDRAKGRHILLKTEGKSKEEIEKIRKRAEDLLKQAKGNADFAELAKKNSEDPGSASRGGDLDWFTREQMVPEFSQAAFSLKPNQISDIVTTKYGFHILQVTGREDAHLRSFDEVKDQLQKERQKQMLYDYMTSTMDKIHDALVKTPGQSEPIARQYNVHFIQVEKAGRGDPLPQIGASTEFSDALFDLKKKDDVTPVVQTQGNKLVVGMLDEIFPEKPAELAEVATSIRNGLVNERTQQLARQKAQDAIQKAKEMGGDMKKVAAALGLEAKTTPEFSKDGAVEGIGASQYVEEAFHKDPGAVFGPVNANGNQFICKVVSRIPADMGKFAEQRNELVSRVKQKKTQERKDLFEDGIVQYMQRNGKVKINKDAVSRITSAFKNS